MPWSVSQKGMGTSTKPWRDVRSQAAVAESDLRTFTVEAEESKRQTWDVVALAPMGSAENPRTDRLGILPSSFWERSAERDSTPRKAGSVSCRDTTTSANFFEVWTWFQPTGTKQQDAKVSKFLQRKGQGMRICLVFRVPQTYNTTAHLLSIAFLCDRTKVSFELRSTGMPNVMPFCHSQLEPKSHLEARQPR